jgi:CxxC motif-containing protein (DUF1111 family)
MAHPSPLPAARRRRAAPLLLVAVAAIAFSGALAFGTAATEAPAGFDGLTNGFQSQAQLDLDREVFAEAEEVDEGLGPLYNARGCAECHGQPVTGGSSQVTELRAGHYDGARFVDPPGGSLINDRATEAGIQERVTLAQEVRTFRGSPTTLGDGFVEVIADSTLLSIAAHQPPPVRGLAIQVPVNEAPGVTRVGRFGWKDQHASLVSFSADAYLNEMGITSPLQPAENTSMGASVAAYDTVPDPEEPPTADSPAGEDIDVFARFMRSTKVPPRDAELASSPNAIAGAGVFARIGCATCHVPDIVTAPAGTSLNGGTFVVPAALGDKIIHPYSDFLLHDVGTGDGIVQNGGQASRRMLRTAPLWGLRTRDRLMHDGLSLTRTEAILRHGNQAKGATQRFLALSQPERDQLMAFLASL